MAEDIWYVLSDEEVTELIEAGLREEANKPKAHHDLHCEGCGRFAKWGGDRHYYNGTWDCYSYDIICSKCGTHTVECV